MFAEGVGGYLMVKTLKFDDLSKGKFRIGEHIFVKQRATY